MKTLKELLEERNAAIEKLEAMKAQCVAEKRAPTDEERAAGLALVETVEALDKDIEWEKRTTGVIDAGERLKEERAKTLESQNDKENRSGKPARSGAPGAYGFGQFLIDVRNHAMQRTPSPQFQQRAATGLNEGQPSAGGFLVQTDHAQALFQNAWDNSAVLSRITKIPISSNANGMTFNGVDESSRATGSRWGGMRAYWAAEADEKTASKPKFRQIEMKLQKCIGLCYATDELLADAQALSSFIQAGFGQELDFTLVDGIINGTGVGQPLGILNANCTVAQAKEGGQDADTVVAENIINMWARLKATSRPNAVWLINQEVEPQLHTMALSVGTGGVPVYMPAGGLSQSPYGMLMGRPVLPIEHCAALGDKGDVILADLSQYLGITKGGLQSDMSIHVRFIYDESVFRFVYRFNGQPILGKAITPYKGSATQSHFVTLAARA
jgi:HK97 family phage major capsid protein